MEKSATYAAMDRCRHDKSNVRHPFAIGSFAAELAFVESIARDGEYQCRLWFAYGGLIHGYQTDSSSKKPAP
jgi:hypothetical protein